MELVSVIVPVYNVEEYIGECIESLLQQSHYKLEIILIDDGSTDGSGEICDKYAKVDERVKVIHIDNMGVSAARNKGLEIARGDYIGFVDADDWIESNMYETMLQFMKDKKAQICVTPNYYINDKQNKDIDIIKNECISKDKAIELLLNSKFPTSLCLSFYKKTALKNIFLNEEIYYWEDFEYQFKALCNSSKVAICDNMFYHIRTRTGSATRRAVNMRNCTCLLIPKIVEEYIDNNMKQYNVHAQKLKYKFFMDLVVGFCERGIDDPRIVGIIKNEARKLWKNLTNSSGMTKKSKTCIILTAIHPNIFRLVYKTYYVLKKQEGYS